MSVLLLLMFLYCGFSDAAHFRYSENYQLFCPLESCYVDFDEGRFYRPQAITLELVQECKRAVGQLQRCLRNIFQANLDTVCKDCHVDSYYRLPYVLIDNQTSTAMLEETNCYNLCFNNDENDPCRNICGEMEFDLYHDNLPAQDTWRILACDECQQQMVSRCPTHVHEPWVHIWHAYAVLSAKGCPLQDRRFTPCPRYHGSDACREDLPEPVTKYIACADEGIAELPQCDGLKELERLEVNAILRHSADVCRLRTHDTVTCHA